MSISGECIVDFEENVSIPGKFIIGEENDEIVIDDNAVFYNPNN